MVGVEVPLTPLQHVFARSGALPELALEAGQVQVERDPLVIDEHLAPADHERSGVQIRRCPVACAPLRGKSAGPGK